MAHLSKYIMVGVLILGLAAGGAAVYAYGWFESTLEPVNPGSADMVEFRVSPGQGTAVIADALEEAGLVQNALTFRILARQRGMDGSLKSGLYQISQGWDAEAILAILVRGETIWFTVTIPEGYTLLDISEHIVGTGVMDAGEWEDALEWARGEDSPLAGLLPADDTVIDPLEGFLFPDTYQLTETTSARALVEMMTSRLLSIYNELVYDLDEELEVSLNELVTLASIIEKEAVVADERGVISGVFHNRLRIGQPLGACPTVVYVVGNPDLTYDDLEVDSPYNTYANAGLPPGPIASPGRASLEAALFPVDVPYYYFVSRNDGTHAFAITYPEHLRNVNRYQSGQ